MQRVSGSLLAAAFLWTGSILGYAAHRSASLVPLPRAAGRFPAAVTPAVPQAVPRAPPGVAPPPRSALARDGHGVASYEALRCQNRTVSYKDLTIYVVSSAATYAARFPAIERTWVRAVERSGATVRVFVGIGEGNFSDARIIRIALDIGPTPCASQPAAHCDAVFREQARLMLATAQTPLVLRVDDDTVIHPARFMEAIGCMPDQDAELWMLGHCMKANWEARAFCSGGPGFTFPSSLLPWFAACNSGLSRADDVQASWCALDRGAALVNHPAMFFEPQRTEGWVSAHHVPPDKVAEFF